MKARRIAALIYLILFSTLPVVDGRSFASDSAAGSVFGGETAARHPENSSSESITSAKRKCCSRHGGVCGCEDGKVVCCDGTLSLSCSCDPGTSTASTVPSSPVSDASRRGLLGKWKGTVTGTDSDYGDLTAELNIEAVTSDEISGTYTWQGSDHTKRGSIRFNAPYQMEGNICSFELQIGERRLEFVLTSGGSNRSTVTRGPVRKKKSKRNERSRRPAAPKTQRLDLYGPKE